MAIVVVTISILVLTGLVWLANRVLTFHICPICAGVSGTWLWLLTGMYFGLLPASDFQLPASMLMGGSVVGIAYQLEKRLPANRSALLWKTVFIPTGFIAVSGLLSFWWPVFLPAAALMIAAALFFTRQPSGASPEPGRPAQELEDKMKDCC